MLNTLSISAALSVFSLLGAHLYGRALHLANPDGILMGAHVIGEEPPLEPAYPLGFMLGGGGFALCAFFAALSFFIAARFFWPQYKELSTRIIISSLVAGVVVAIAALVVNFNYSTYQVAI